MPLKEKIVYDRIVFVFIIFIQKRKNKQITFRKIYFLVLKYFCFCYVFFYLSLTKKKKIMIISIKNSDN